MAEGSATGSSKCQIARGRCSKYSSGPIEISRCSVPRGSAVSLASVPSETEPKIMVKVLTFWSDICDRDIRVAIMLESIPPERKEPTGTSAIMWCETESFIVPRILFLVSPSLSARFSLNLKCQYLSILKRPSLSTSMKWAGGNLKTPLKKVSSNGLY